MAAEATDGVFALRWSGSWVVVALPFYSICIFLPQVQALERQPMPGEPAVPDGGARVSDPGEPH